MNRATAGDNDNLLIYGKRKLKIEYNSKYYQYV